jgi:hypothetical protein
MSVLALSGHSGTSDHCPLLGVKRTGPAQSKMFAFDPSGFLRVVYWARVQLASGLDDLHTLEFATESWVG